MILFDHNKLASPWREGERIVPRHARYLIGP